MAVLAAAAMAAVLGGSAPTAAAKTKKPRSRVVSADTPLGLQGTAGAGGNVVIPFLATDIAGRPVDVEVQYGLDLNMDGEIADDEYRPATEDRFDPRDTRDNRAPQLFWTGTNAGAMNAFVWRSLADVGTARFPAFEYALTPQGRYIPDPDNPGSYLYAIGPTGSPDFGGVKIRMRTIVHRRTKHGPELVGEWAYTDAFVLDNSNPPSATIDDATSGDAVTVHWTVYDADSEDLNGNGQLDIALGEDINGNGVLDCEKVGVAFDWHRLAPGEDPAAMSDAQLETLRWQPCTRLAGAGDTDSLDARPGVPIPTEGDLAGLCSAPPGVGRHWTFVWDAVRDADVTTDGYILRATPFDEHRNRGATFYSRIVVHTGQ
jgi:hypothetical protein